MKCQIHDDRNTAGRCACSEIVTAVRLILGSTERMLAEILDLPVPADGGLGYDLRVRAESARLAAIRAVIAPPSQRSMRLIWFQRPDGLWNADCTCGAACCGIHFNKRSTCEEWHFQKADEDRKNGNKYLPCGPKFPEENVNMPGPFVFP